jgi:hypothetical protein
MTLNVNGQRGPRVVPVGSLWITLACLWISTVIVAVLATILVLET